MGPNAAVPVAKTAIANIASELRARQRIPDTSNEARTLLDAAWRGLPLSAATDDYLLDRRTGR